MNASNPKPQLVPDGVALVRHANEFVADGGKLRDFYLDLTAQERAAFDRELGVSLDWDLSYGPKFFEDNFSLDDWQATEDDLIAHRREMYQAIAFIVAVNLASAILGRIVGRWLYKKMTR